MTFNIQETLSKICLSQEGKGRVNERKQKVYFTYETLNEPEKSLYQLILDVPLYGSEALSVDYKEVERPVVKLEEDSFKKRKSMRNFMLFIQKFAKFIVLQQAILKNGSQQYCDDNGAFLECALEKGQEAFTIKKLEELVRVSVPVGSKRSLEFEFFDLKEKYFERVKAKYRNIQLDRDYFETDLFLGSCYDKS